MKLLNSFFLLFAFVFASAQNVLKIKDLEAGPGETAKLYVSLSNIDAVSGFQFKIVAPQGLILKEREVKLSGRQTDHVVYPKRLATGEYLFVCFSGKSDNLNGNNGDLLEIPVEIPLNYVPGTTYQVKFNEGILSSSTGEKLMVTTQDGTLKVTQGKTADLMPENISAASANINPNEPLTVKWNVKNIGELEGANGWQEQISLISADAGKRYIIGYSSYNDALAAGASVSREQTFTLPKVLGFEGTVRVEVKIIPNSGLKEPELLSANNIATSQDLQISKRLFLELDRIQVSENIAENIRVAVSRSGNYSSEEIVTIASEKNAFGEPVTAKFEVNKSSSFIYLKPADNKTYEGDRDVKITASSNSYPNAVSKIKLIDDEHLNLSISYPAASDTKVGSKINFTLSANFPKNQDTTVLLSTDSKTRIILPTSVLLPAGQISVNFIGEITDTGLIEKTKDAGVFAKADGYTTGITTIKLNASGIPDFKISLSQNQISEGDGIKAAYAKISRTTNLDKEAVVSISEDPTGNLILPNEIIFEKGATEKNFTIGTVDNSMVEGARNVKIWSKVKFPSCNCTDLLELTANTSATIEIVDNDGLSLAVLAQPSTLKAGVSGKVKISRNSKEASILQNAVVLNLANDNPSAVFLPATATIPAGASEIWVDFSTKIDASSTGDKTVRITASASGYANGFGWLLLTDQNKADISVESISVPDNILAAQKIKVSTNFKNMGFADFAAGSKVEYYLSKTTDISGLAPIRTSYTSQAIAKDSNITLTDELQLPSVAGSQYLTVVINGNQIINELAGDNNQKSVRLEISPSYSVQVSLDKKVYKQGETVKVTGIAKTNTGAGVASAPVEITLKNAQFTRVYNVKTNSDGVFVYDFIPVQNESGTYSISAAYPGATSQSAAVFDILGFEIINKPQYIKWETLVNVPLGKELTLRNTTTSRLTDVKIEIPENYNLAVEQSPITLEPNATAVLSYKLISKEPSKELKYEEISMKITSSEGAVISETVYFHSRMPEPTLVASPVSINTTMIKGQKRLYEFTVKNTGAADAQDIEVKLPVLEWMHLASSQNILSIKAGEEAKIALELEPTIKEQANVPVIGNLALVPKNGSNINIPFTIETVSTDSGKLIIDAVDEYFYNTVQAPHLKGAKVTIKHPYTGAVITEGITGDNGVFEVPALKEGWYTVSVTADKHDSYQNNIMVDPGKTTSITAYLPYKAVSYSWDVKPTEIQDQYDINLNVQFETNVPKPVIVMEIDNNKLDLKPGESRMTYVTVTNHGLIGLQQVKINIQNTSEYEFTPLITSLDMIDAKSSVVIPVLLKNISTSGRLASDRAGGTCIVPLELRGIFPCGDGKEMFSISGYVNTNCPAIPSIGGGGGVGTPYCSSGSCGWGGGYGSAGSYSPVSTNNIDICNPCLKMLIGMATTCIPALKTAMCIFKLVTIGGWDSAALAINDCLSIISPSGCIYKIAFSLIKGYKCWYPHTVFAGAGGAKMAALDQRILENSKNDTEKVLEIITTTYDAAVNRYTDVFGTKIIENNDVLKLMLQNFGKEIGERKQLDSSKKTKTLTVISASYPEYYNEVVKFYDKWAMSVIYWNSNDYDPNNNDFLFISLSKLNAYDKVINDAQTYAESKGYISTAEMIESTLNEIENYAKKKMEEPQSSVCASVTLEFPQKMTMTREAFEGTLKVNNSSTKEVKDINLDLIVTDANGENKTALFQINKDAFINGNGLVPAGTSGSGKALFIPTKEAAPTVPQSYNFGGVLSYFDAEINERVYVTLKPVTLQVNPSPDLELHYFMQRNILGDDALTEDNVEPVIPAELSLLIKNDGYGEARNVQVESIQPKIVDNEKGLAIDFNMIGSNFNNQPKELGLLNVNFGNIAPKTTSVGQWWFTSSLMGHFVKYDVKLNHASSFGNSKLSLIKSAYIHELIKSVKDYSISADAISDFLVNDVADAHDSPDRIYLSNGNSEEVFKAESVTVSEKVTSSVKAVKLTINPFSSGWNYGYTDDPGANLYRLEKVIRDNDQKEMPIQNFWQTHVTLKDGLNPKYENMLHVLDHISGPATYTLYYKPIDGNIPEVLRFEDIPSENSPVPVETLKVKFNKEIDVNTFTNEDVELIFQGKKLPSDNILIGKIDATTYSISIKGLTLASGYYQLTVHALGIKDMLGNEGRDGKKISWIQFVNELGILDFKSDQINKQPVNTITVIFNKKIRSEEFTADKVSINGQPTPNVKISKIDDYTYAISGIQEYNKDNAEYTIKINTPKITSEDGVKGIAEQSYKWIVNTTTPEVSKITPWYQGALHPQHITDFEIKLNEKIVSGLDATSFILFKDGQKLPAGFTLKNVDDTTYVLSNISGLTSQNGFYKLVVSQSSFKDENGNFGAGHKEFAWQVNHQNLNAVSNLRLTPDKGISNTDNITSGDVKLAFETLQDHLKIEVYELQATQPVLVETIDASKAGSYTVPLNVSGAKKFKVLGYDTHGNTSQALYLNGYIDNTDFGVAVEPVKLLPDACSGFDYVNVKFTEAVQSLPAEAITITSSGVIQPQENLNIKKIDDYNFVIQNLITDSKEQAILTLDKTKVYKKLSGLAGVSKNESAIGIASLGAVNVAGEDKPVIGETVAYTATNNMMKYDWIAVNGEIQQAARNVVNVKWQKTGTQSLILKYVTPSGCTATIVKNVEVGPAGGTLATVENHNKPVSLAPVPNNGNFTIFTNKILKKASIIIYDMSGRVVLSQKNVTIDHRYQLEMRNPVGGIYIVVIQNSEDRFQFRFIVQ